MMRTLLSSCACALSLVGAAFAAPQTIDFDDRTGPSQVSGLVAPGVVITDEYGSQGIVFGRAGASAGIFITTAGGIVVSTPNGACGVDLSFSIGSGCAKDIYFEFVDPSDNSVAATASNLSFWIGDTGGDVDPFEVTAYGLGGGVLEVLTSSDTSFTQYVFSSNNIARIVIDFLNPSGGFLLDDISYDLNVGQPVPVPAAAPLFGAALAGMGFMRRRKR